MMNQTVPEKARARLTKVLDLINKELGGNCRHKFDKIDYNHTDREYDFLCWNCEKFERDCIFEQIGEIYEKHLENEQKCYPTETLSRVIELDYLVLLADSNPISHAG